VQIFCGQGGFFKCRHQYFFDAKNFGFFEIYGVSARTRGEGVEPVQKFFGQVGRGLLFSILDGL